MSVTPGPYARLVPVSQSCPADRKRRGDYPTPHWLVDAVVAEAVPDLDPGRAGATVTVLDPACGDGRFLVAAARRIRAAGGRPSLVGVDVDDDAVGAARRALAAADGAAPARVEHGDALAADWDGQRFDVVVGNPPFLSQLAASTTRGGSSRHGGGPYADAAAEFLALAARLVQPDGGRIGLVLPQSILASRDAAPVRADVDRRATITWSWWSPRPVFDAQVYVCALAFEARLQAGNAEISRSWSHVVTGRLGVPPLPTLAVDGVLGDRARLTANFRDQYYGLVPAVVEDGDGPRLVTSGLVDPGHCGWGERPITFARQRFCRPTVDLDRLSPAMRRWADAMLAPKVLVANQTKVIEAVADTEGRWLPGVPLISVRPAAGADVSSLVAALTSPVASAWAWHHAAGTGLSSSVLRLGPRWLADLPWPAGDLSLAVAALRSGDVATCAAEAASAYGVDPASTGRLVAWWRSGLPGGRSSSR